jgi:integrase/recombinase XerC/integrase/recombinase XerD
MKPINELIEEFIINRNVLPGTKQAYRYALKGWVTWLTINPDADVRSPGRKDVLAWKSELLSMGYTDLTIQSYMKVLALFYSWQETSGHGFNIAKGICKRKKYTGHRKMYLTMEEVTKLLGSMPRQTLIQKRNLAIVNLMVSTGLRCIEVSRLCIKDITPFKDGYTMKIQRKGHTAKDASLCVGLNGFRYVGEYLEERQEDDTSQPLFANHGFHSGSATMSAHIIGQLVGVELGRIGLKGKEYSAHSLRHSFAVLSLLEGASIYDLRIALGHVSTLMTEIYLSSVNDMLGKVNGAVYKLDKRMAEL